MTSDPKDKYIVTFGIHSVDRQAGPPVTHGELKVYDGKTFRLIHDLRGPTYGLNQARVSPDCKLLAAVSTPGGASAADGRTIWVWDLSTGLLLKAFNGHTALQTVPGVKTWVAPVTVNSVDFAPDGKTFATAGCDNRIRFWDTTSDYLEKEGLIGHTDFVERIAFFPAGDRLASVAWDSSAIIWDLKTRKPLHTIKLKNERQWKVDVAVSPDGKTIATADNVEVNIWDATTGKSIEKLELPLPGPSCVAFSSDGKFLAIGFNDYFPKREQSKSLGVVQWSLAEHKFREPVK